MSNANFSYYYTNESKQFEFLEVPKYLYSNENFKDISADGKVLYSLMLCDLKLSKANDLLDENRRLYIIFDKKHIKSELGFDFDKSDKILKELLENKLVESVEINDEQRLYIRKIHTNDYQQLG